MELMTTRLSRTLNIQLLKPESINMAIALNGINGPFVGRRRRWVCFQRQDDHAWSSNWQKGQAFHSSASAACEIFPDEYISEKPYSVFERNK